MKLLGPVLSALLWALAGLFGPDRIDQAELSAKIITRMFAADMFLKVKGDIDHTKLK